MIGEVIVTGATGLIGSTLVETMYKNKLVDKCFLIVRNKNLARKKIEEELNIATSFVEYIDFTDACQLQKEIHLKCCNVKVVFHLASHVTSRDDTDSLISLLNSNINFSTILLNAIKDIGVKTFINTGSFAQYFGLNGSALPYLYAATKSAYEVLLGYYSKTYSFNVINVVPFNVYGKRAQQKKIIDYLIDGLSDQKINLTDGHQELDFIHIDDVCDFYSKLIMNLKLINKDSTFFLGSGKCYTLRQVASIVEGITQKKLNIVWGANPYRPNDIMHAKADLSTTNKFLEWAPKIDIYEGLEMYLSQLEYI